MWMASGEIISGRETVHSVAKAHADSCVRPEEIFDSENPAEKGSMQDPMFSK
jgi:hypothetical protein